MNDQAPMTRGQYSSEIYTGHWELDIHWSLRHWALVICLPLFIFGNGKAYARKTTMRMLRSDECGGYTTGRQQTNALSADASQGASNASWGLVQHTAAK